MNSPPLEYSVIVLCVFLFAALAAIVRAIYPVEFLLLVVNVLCLVSLTGLAVLYKKKNYNFDSTVAGESIVAFGVMGLILSLASAIWPLVLRGDLSEVLQGSGLKDLAIPFLEGLATAGLAPAFAIYLRHVCSEIDGTSDAVGDMTGVTRAMTSLRHEMERVKKEAAQLQTSFGMATEALKGLADNVQSESARLKHTLLEAQGELKSLGAAAKAGGSELGALNKEIENLKSATGAARALMDGLGRMIESVERFVEPGSPH